VPRVCLLCVSLDVYSLTHISVSLFVTHLYRAVNDFRIYVCFHLYLDMVQRTAGVTFVLHNGEHTVSSTGGTVKRLQLTDGEHTINTQVLFVRG
jgi:hypothetical protein